MATIDRRAFVRNSLVTGGVLVLGSALESCTTPRDPSGTTTTTSPATTSTTRATPEPGRLSPGDVLFSLSPTASGASGIDAVRAALGQLDWSWLRRDDSVLVKLAANSGNAHPMVTSPVAVRAVVAELKARGAGRIVVADQAGVEHVRHLADGRRYGSTRELLRRNGIIDAVTASGAEVLAFDDLDFTRDFFAATPPAGSRWDTPIMVPSILKEVDHIVYLPRLAAHAIAGYTSAHKMAIGWLRDDARASLHSNGAAFYENYVDISYTREIGERFRFALLYAEKALLHFGPDSGTVAPVDPRLTLVSTDLASLDAVTTGLLVRLNRTTPPASAMSYSRSSANTINSYFVSQMVQAQTGLPWGPDLRYRALAAHRYEDGVSGDRSLSRAWAVRGGRPSRVQVVRHGAAPLAPVVDAVTEHGEGMLSFV